MFRLNLLEGQCGGLRPQDETPSCLLFPSSFPGNPTTPSKGFCMQS